MSSKGVAPPNDAAGVAPPNDAATLEWLQGVAVRIDRRYELTADDNIIIIRYLSRA